MARAHAPISSVRARAYRIPTDAPEADGTLEWDATTMVVVQVEAAGATGLGYTYADAAAAGIVRGTLAPILAGEDAFAIAGLWNAMRRQVRNMGEPGIAACAISAVDVALWDLKARLLDIPLHRLLGARRARVPIYGSGGFLTYDDDRLAAQLAGWVEREGCARVKMKIGADPARERARMRVARAAIGDGAALMIDANGALEPRRALAIAAIADGEGVDWFEEPVTSDDPEGLALVRAQAPGAVEVAAGEYGYNPHAFRRLLETRAVDVLQIDATRALGITGFLAAAELAAAFAIPVSAHTAPALHGAPAAAAANLRHVEWFHDHARIEAMLLDGAPVPTGGAIAPNEAPGHGLTFKEKEAERYAT